MSKRCFPAWEEQFFQCLGNLTPRIVRLTQGESKIEMDSIQILDVYLHHINNLYEQLTQLQNIYTTIKHLFSLMRATE